MRFDKKSRGISPATASTDPVTRANWPDRAAGFILGHGGEGFVIRPLGAQDGPATPAQWRAWLAYMAWRGIPTVFMRKHRLATVPCEWPEDFDLTAASSDRTFDGVAELEPSEQHNADMRARIAGEFRKLRI